MPASTSQAFQLRARSETWWDFLLGKLSRVTSSGDFIPEIDGLRFLAISAVVIFHLNGDLLTALGSRSAIQPDWAATIASKGAYGVQLFFAISGFILALPFASEFLGNRKPVSLKRYFLRRVTRLEPPYILNLVLTFLFAVLVGASQFKQLLPHLLASIFYVHNVIYAKESLVNMAAWSLEIEIQFYLLVPLLSLIFALRGKLLRRFLISGMMLSLGVAQVLFLTEPGRMSLSILNNLQFFLAGFLLADFYLTDWRGSSSPGLRWDVIGCACMPLLYLSGLSRFGGRVMFPFLTFIFYCSVLRGRTLRRVFSWRPVTVTGGMCYTIYLYHSSIIQLLGRRTMQWRFGNHYFINLFCELAFLYTVIVALCSIHFVLIEKPCMRSDWHRRAWVSIKKACRYRLVRPSPIEPYAALER